MTQLISLKVPLSYPKPPFEDYNSFFHPNVCHVCKTTKRLTECPSCRMISYCSEEHKMLHRAQHNEICQAILTCSTYWNIYNSRGKTLEEWTEFKKMNMQCIIRSLNRDLEPHEREMFLFAKSCIVCRVQDLLVPCVDCFSINMCANHYLRARKHSCEKLLLCFSLHIETVSRNNRDSKIPLKYLFFDKNAIHDMPAFIRECIQREGKIIFWSLNDYIYTDDFSGPLTLIYVMQRVRLLNHQQITSQFIVHVVVENFIDTRKLSAWEVLLHVFPQHTRLIVVIMGPTLPNRSLTWRCCLNCRENSRELEFEYCRVSCPINYAHNVFNGTPDVIIGFNTDLGNNKICPKSMKALWRQSRLLILTAKSEDKADSNTKWIRKVLGPHIVPLVKEKNRFASLRPHRDYENDSVFYSNQYITIYCEFKNINGPVQVSDNDRE